jgi:hypothetical protein
MKLRFTNSKAIEEWFDRAPKCGAGCPSLDVYSANRRIMAKGHTLFSYGTHFALAMWYPDEKIFLVNYTRRSASTSKHQCYVKRHAPVDTSIEVGNLIDYDPRKSADKFLARWDNRIRQSLDKSKRAYRHRGWWIRRAEHDLAERNKFITTFGITAIQLPEDVTAALVTLKLAA